MKIAKKIDGFDICLEIIKIKDYPKYGLYQIYKIEDGKQIPLYKECYTTMQIKKMKSGNIYA